ncbi:hypothetical protein H0H92_010231 [Tricholoma furcatifolium]|nr:hypothetical protein H0H92_010231 [Tricholoma furcatifolium]
MSTPTHLIDAEKGLFDKHEHPITVTLSPVLAPSTSQSDDSHDTDKTVVKAILPAPAPPPQAKKPRPGKVNIWIQGQLWFNTYRKFFTFVISLNIVGIAFATSGKWEYPRNYSGACVLGNLLMAILMRNELFGRLLYLFVNTLFAKWTPVTHISILVFGLITLVIIGISIMSAFPWVRNTHHNVFERHHRFMGWLGLLTTWAFVILGDSWDTSTQSWNPNGIRVVHQQDFWFVLGMTIFVVIPWCTIREVHIDVEIPSPKVVIMRFERGMQQGLLARISRGSIMEYHAFGIISEGRNARYHYLICGVQGDFTRGLVENPPKRIWTRELKFAGVSNTSTLYKRGIRVCTGTGLGAALSTCLQVTSATLTFAKLVDLPTSLEPRLEKTFGPTISGLIHNNLGPERVTLWDSKKRGGRPDVMKLIKETYVSWGAEVIFITSNFQGNKEMMEGCKEAGIPAFGTLWDF